jgi:hypothetical protein
MTIKAYATVFSLYVLVSGYFATDDTLFGNPYYVGCVSVAIVGWVAAHAYKNG